MEQSTYNKKIKNKLIILLIIMAVIFFALVFRLFYVAVINGELYAAKASRQQTKSNTLMAQRGRIIDTNGIVLAQSGTSYRVLVNPQVIADSERVRISIEVSDILGLDYDYVYERVCRVEKQQIVLKRQVEASVVDQLEALQLGSGISFSADIKRYFPLGKLFAQLIGFTGTEGEGQAGLEAAYNTSLAGSNGRLVTEVDRNNNTLADGEQEYIPATDGYDLTLTVDSVTETYMENVLEQCYQAYGASECTCMIMNPNTGEILATSTYPTYDLNAPPRSDVTALLEMSRNYGVSETFEPKDLFKLIVIAAALDSGTITLDSTYRCTGYIRYGLDNVYCTNTDGHGSQTVLEALANQCDCVFMKIAKSMDKNTLYDYMYAFGLGESTESGLPGEDSGTVTHRKYIRDKELAYLSCGNDLEVTPMQMLRIVGAMVNGGILVQPYVMSSVTDTDGNVIKSNSPTPIRRVISEETSAQMRELLQSYMDLPVAAAAQIINYSTGGFTATTPNTVEGEESDVYYYSNFIQYMPADDPQLICYLMIENPQVPVAYGRSIAAYYSGRILESLINYYTILPDNADKDIREVPNVVGMTMTDAYTALNDQHFTTNSLEDEAEATVVRQIPEAGTKMVRGSRVVLLNSMTTLKPESNVFVEYVEVPDLLKQRRSEALDLCLEQGLTMNFDHDNCTGYVTAQSIEPGTLVTKGTEISVVFNGYYAASGNTTPTPEVTETPLPGTTPVPGETDTTGEETIQTVE